MVNRQKAEPVRMTRPTVCAVYGTDMPGLTGSVQFDRLAIASKSTGIGGRLEVLQNLPVQGGEDKVNRHVLIDSQGGAASSQERTVSGLPRPGIRNHTKRCRVLVTQRFHKP